MPRRFAPLSRLRPRPSRQAGKSATSILYRLGGFLGDSRQTALWRQEGRAIMVAASPMTSNCDEYELAWPPQALAISYRLLVTDDSGARVLDVVCSRSRSTIELPRSELTRYHWRVMARQSAVGAWQDHLPELVLMSDRLRGQSELGWPSAPDALAFRIVVRDDEIDAVVLKDAFLRSPGRLDWSRLDPSHLHRVRVQAFVDGGWRDHLPYRYVFPPRELAGEVVELRWPGEEGVSGYRLLVGSEHGGPPVLDLEVSEPEVLLPAARLPSGVRLAWRVLVRRGDGSGWEEYLPELVLADDALREQPQMTWPDDPEAVAYRIVVRDDGLGEVVLKDSFLRSPGFVDWSRLDTEHVHRACVQAWRGRTWQEHVPYRLVAAPPGTRDDALELSWPEDPDASLYRLVIRSPDGQTLVDGELAEPMVRLPSTSIPNDVQLHWRVDVQRIQRADEDRRWEPYLPEMALGLTTQPEFHFSELHSALAYRLLIYDEADVLVLRDAFLRSPGRLDWSRLDPSHLHRVRVQAFVDGGWRDHLPYRYVFPPRELAGEVVELRWPGEEGVSGYRLLVGSEHGGPPVLDLEVSEPEVLLPAARLPSGVRLAWRVLVRRGDGSGWEEYLPELVLADDALREQPELHWPPMPGAAAYRIMVTDLERRITVSKLGFLESPGRIDWSRLALAHPHRVRVEAWEGRNWRAHVPARRVFPPPARVLVGTRSGAPRRLRHVVIVPFAAGMPDTIYGVERPRTLLARRLDLFLKWTVPSLDQLSQQGVAWFVLPEAGLPEAVTEVIRRRCEGHVIGSDVVPTRIDAGAASGIATCWLMAGDAIHPGVLAAVERRAAELSPSAEGFGVDLALLVEVNPDGANLVHDASPRRLFVAVTPGPATVDPADPTHPRLRVGSLAHIVADWGVAAVLRSRPGPNEHPIFLRQRGPAVGTQLLRQFGVQSLKIGESGIVLA